MDVNKYEWGDDWEYQPFSISKGWDDSGDNLVEKFCQTLVQNAEITYSGKQQGVCEVYGKGSCTRTENNECAMFEHVSPTNDGASVVFAVTYSKDGIKCNVEDKPVNFSKLGLKTCVDKLTKNLINKCKFSGNPKKSNGYTDHLVLGGTYWDECMRYTIVAVKNPPQVAW